MALQKTMEYKGLPIPNAYIKITGLSGNKNSVFYTLGVFVDKLSSESPKENTIKALSFSFIPSQDENAPRWDKQAYEDAKTRVELEGAVNLLDDTETV